jgi:hypothetical protein
MCGKTMKIVVDTGKLKDLGIAVTRVNIFLVLENKVWECFVGRNMY